MNTLAVATDGYLPQLTPLSVYSQGYLFAEGAVAVHYVTVPYYITQGLAGAWVDGYAEALMSEAKGELAVTYADGYADALYVSAVYLEAQL